MTREQFIPFLENNGFKETKETKYEKIVKFGSYRFLLYCYVDGTLTDRLNPNNINIQPLFDEFGADELEKMEEVSGQLYKEINELKERFRYITEVLL